MPYFIAGFFVAIALALLGLAYSVQKRALKVNIKHDAYNVEALTDEEKIKFIAHLIIHENDD